MSLLAAEPVSAIAKSPDDLDIVTISTRPDTVSRGEVLVRIYVPRSVAIPSTGNMQAEYLPNSTFTQLPWDYLHPNHAGYIAMGEAVNIQPFAPSHNR